MNDNLRIMIVDDEPMSVETTAILLRKHASNVEIVATAMRLSEAVGKIKKHTPDVVFMDIKMPHGSGFDLLDQFDKPNFQVVFVTAYDQYALKAFKYSAVDYLLKPFSVLSLLEAVEKTRARKLQMSVQEGVYQQLTVHLKEGVKIITLSEIMYLAADSNYTTFYKVNEEKIMVSKTLKFYEEQIPNSLFFRIHYSFIVNRLFIKSTFSDTHQVQMTNGEILPVSSRRYKPFLSWLRSDSD